MKYFKLNRKAQKFEVGDKVRILLWKSPFHRGYNLQRSYERFKIDQIINHKIPFYILRDEKDRIISGYFNDYELVKINLAKYRSNVLSRKKVRGKNWVKLSFKVTSIVV